MADPIETMYKIIRRIKRRYNCSTGLPRPSEPGSSAAHDHLGSLHAACADPSYCGCHNRHPCGSSSYADRIRGRLRPRATDRGSLPLAGAARRSGGRVVGTRRSEEHTSELQSLLRISYAVFCLKKKIRSKNIHY